MAKDYTIIKDIHVETLVRNVKEHLDHGWIPIGGVSMVAANVDKAGFFAAEIPPDGVPIIYAQSMMLE